jgi:hypothetical protein
MLQAKIEQKNHSRMLSEIYFPHKSYGFRDIKKKGKILAVSSLQKKRILQDFILEKLARIFQQLCLFVILFASHVLSELKPFNIYLLSI